jgi:3-methyladenine DNA glycosylase Tag
MKVLIDIPDAKAPSLMEVLNHISYVKVKPLADSKARLMMEVREAVEEMQSIRAGKKNARLPLKIQQELSDYIEFLLRKYQADHQEKPFFGCMQGTVTWMSDDFNAPLDDFKEYM